MHALLTRIAAALALATIGGAIPTITSKGNKFFTSNGEQWFIKGVAYQPTGDDPLANPVQCALDAPLMKQLGTNTIRVYHVDASANHDACMQTFAGAGIYAFVDVSTYSNALTESVTPTYTVSQFENYTAVMSAFVHYPNIAGFIIGNEVLNIPGPLTVTAPFIKAATADLKAYRDKMGYPKVAVGYAHADVGGLRPALPDYLSCGSDASQAIDFFALNSYLYCGTMTYDQSGYHALLEQTKDYPVPIFMSETGCNVPEPRNWGDMNFLLGQMNSTWSGGIAYAWVQADNHYGLITYGGGNTDAMDFVAPPGGYLDSGAPTPITPDFSNLLTVWSTNTPTGISAGAYAPSNTPPPCPAFTAGVWEVSGNPLPLPTLGIGVLNTLAPATTPAAASSLTASPAAVIASSLAGLPVVIPNATVPASITPYASTAVNLVASSSVQTNVAVVSSISSVAPVMFTTAIGQAISSSLVSYVSTITSTTPVMGSSTVASTFHTAASVYTSISGADSLASTPTVFSPAATLAIDFSTTLYLSQTPTFVSMSTLATSSASQPIDSPATSSSTQSATPLSISTESSTPALASQIYIPPDSVTLASTTLETTTTVSTTAVVTSAFVGSSAPLIVSSSSIMVSSISTIVPSASSFSSSGSPDAVGTTSSNQISVGPVVSSPKVVSSVVLISTMPSSSVVRSTVIVAPTAAGAAATVSSPARVSNAAVPVWGELRLGIVSGMLALVVATFA